MSRHPPASLMSWFMIVLMIVVMASRIVQAFHVAPFVVPRGGAAAFCQQQSQQQRQPQQPRRYCSTTFSSSSSSSILRCSMVLERKDVAGTTPSFDNNRNQWDLQSPSTVPSSSSSSSPPTVSLLNRFKNMHDANMALDQLAEACGQLSKESSPSEIIAKAAQAEELWNQLQQQAAAAKNPTTTATTMTPTTATTMTPTTAVLQPDVISFNTVLKAWSKTSQSLADYKQQAVLFGAVKNNNNNYNSPNQSVVSSIPVYTARDAAERVTTLLMQQEEDESGATTVRPDTTSYNIAIDTWAKSRVEDAPLTAERLLQRLIDTRPDLQPDSLTYNGLVDAWSYSGRPESLAKLEQLHKQMEDIYQKHQQLQGSAAASFTPNNNNNNAAPTKGNRGNNAANNVVKPSIRAVNSILHAHAKRAQEYTVKDPTLARRAADDARVLLNRMTQKYESTHDPDYQPDVASYSTVMDAYGRCGTHDAILEAEALLQELKALYQRTNSPRHEPNIRTYTTLISAWAKVTHADEAPQRAQALLEEIKHLKNHQHHHYNNNNNNSSSQHQQNQQQSQVANARTYLAVIQCWARSRDSTKAQRALQILRTMKELYQSTKNPDVRPNLVTYNAAIDACAKCQGTTAQQTDSLKIAFAILKAIQAESDMQANHVTYATLLKATSALLPAGEERNKVAQAVFAKAQQAGMVDYYTISNLRKAVDVNLLQQLLKDMQDRQGYIDYKKIPQAWCKNVLSLKQ